MKEFKCTSKIKHAFMKFYALERLVEKYVENDNHHRAVETQILSEQQRQKAWGYIYELYPKITNKPFEYINSKNILRTLK